MKIKLTLYLITILISFTSIAQSVKDITYTYTDINGYSCPSHLYIDGKETLYLINDPRPSGTVNVTEEVFYKIYNDKWSRIFYKNGSIEITRLPIYGRELVYTPPIAPKLKLTGKSKTIGKYKCQEALITRGGRTYRIWFAPDVPITVGPWGLSNVPGIVVELTDEHFRHFKIQLTQISNGTKDNKYSEYKKYLLSKKVLTNDAYNKEIIKIISNKKRDVIALLAQYNANIEMENEAAYTEPLIDIPEGLVKELHKIK